MSEPSPLNIVLGELQRANSKLDRIEDAIARQDQMLKSQDAAIFNLNRLVWADSTALTSRVSQIETSQLGLLEEMGKVNSKLDTRDATKWNMYVGILAAVVGAFGSLLVWGLDNRPDNRTVESPMIQINPQPKSLPAIKKPSN